MLGVPWLSTWTYSSPCQPLTPPRGCPTACRGWAVEWWGPGRRRWLHRAGQGIGGEVRPLCITPFSHSSSLRCSPSLAFCRVRLLGYLSGAWVSFPSLQAPEGDLPALPGHGFSCICFPFLKTCRLLFSLSFQVNSFKKIILQSFGETLWKG